jgi:Ricin-type beta-trefoil lectin domain
VTKFSSRDSACFTAGRPTGSAAPLNWAEGQYLRLAQSIDAGYNLDSPSVVKAKYRGAGAILGAAGKCIDAGDGVDNGSTIRIFTCDGTDDAQGWTWNSSDGTLRALDKCMDVTGGVTASGTAVQLWECNGTGAQEWRWRQQTRLVNPQSGRCLEVFGSERLQISNCNDAAAQVWRLP